MEEVSFSPNNLKIEEITLVNFKGVEKDISGIFRVFSFEEDIFMSTMVGEISIVEMHDFQQNFPLIGEEKLRAKFRTNEDFPLIEVEFCVYSITDKVEVGNGMFGYRLNLCSAELLKSRSIRSTNFIQNKNPANVTKSILEKLMDSKKSLIADRVGNAVTFVCPNLNPIEFINHLVARSRSAETNTFSYVFYESTNGFNYRSIDKLKDAKPQSYSFQNKSTVQVNIDSLRVIEKMALEEQQNILDRLEVGGYGANTTFFDPINRTITKKSFSYFNEEDFKKLKKTSGESKKLGFQSSEFDMTEPYREMILPLTDRAIGKAERLTTINLIEYGIKMSVDIPGNSSLHAGDMIDIQFPSATGEDITQNEEDRFLAGKWMVVSLKHTINQQTYKQSAQLAKDSFSSDHEKGVDKMVKRIVG